MEENLRRIFLFDHAAANVRVNDLTGQIRAGASRKDWGTP